MGNSNNYNYLPVDFFQIFKIKHLTIGVYSCDKLDKKPQISILLSDMVWVTLKIRRPKPNRL